MKKLLVLIAAALFVAGSVMPVMAQDKAEWGFYGSARMWTAWEMKDGDTPGGSNAVLGTPGIAGVKLDDDDLNWSLQSNSRIGATVKFGNIGGRFEYGHTSGVTNRLIYGTWNFGPGTLLVGQDYTPLFFPVSDQCGFGGGDCGLIFWGTVYTGRVPQLKLTMGGLKIGLMTPSTSQKLPLNSISEVLVQPGGTAPTAASAGAAGPLFGSAVVNNLGTDPTTGITGYELFVPGFNAVDTDTTLPEFEASYTFNLGPAALIIGGAYGTYDVRGVIYNAVTQTYAEHDYSIDAWLLNVAGRMNFGPFYVNFSAALGQNIGDYGITGDIPAAVKTAGYIRQTNSIEDADNVLLALILGFRLSDAIKLEGGVGYLSGERVIRPGVELESKTMSYYLQMAWSPAKNAFIIPEIGWIDYGDRKQTGALDVDQGKATWLGIKWQINF